MIVALGLSILFSLVVGIIAARNKRAETVIIPLLDVFQSIPILGFFPIVVFGIVEVIPGALGVNVAVVVLIFTSMSWNITFGVYEAVKSIPQDYIDLSSISGSSSWERIRTLYIPASLGRIASNTQTSWAVGLFYLVSSEILTLGTTQVKVQGIGVAAVTFFLSQNYKAYTYSLFELILAVVIWQFIFLRELSLWAEKYKFIEEPRGTVRDPLMRFYSWVNHRSISKLFLYGHGRGVTRFTSSLARFRRGLKYSLLILILVFVLLEFSALVSLGETTLRNFPSVQELALSESTILVALGFSFARIWYVYLFCVALSLPLGIAIALNNRVYAAAVPILEVVASIPAPILLPALTALVSHSGELVAAIIIFLGMIWYILFNVMGGIRSMPAELWELRMELRVSGISAWRNIYIPAVLTSFVTGSITAVGAAWNTLIVAEYFCPSLSSSCIPLTSVDYGIGKTIEIATIRGDLATLTLSVLSMTFLIVIFNLTVWRRVYHFVTRRYTYNR